MRYAAMATPEQRRAANVVPPAVVRPILPGSPQPQQQPVPVVEPVIERPPQEEEEPFAEDGEARDNLDIPIPDDPPVDEQNPPGRRRLYQLVRESHELYVDFLRNSLPDTMARINNTLDRLNQHMDEL